MERTHRTLGVLQVIYSPADWVGDEADTLWLLDTLPAESVVVSVVSRKREGAVVYNHLTRTLRRRVAGGY